MHYVTGACGIFERDCCCMPELPKIQFTNTSAVQSNKGDQGLQRMHACRAGTVFVTVGNDTNTTAGVTFPDVPYNVSCLPAVACFMYDCFCWLHSFVLHMHLPVRACQAPALSKHLLLYRRCRSVPVVEVNAACWSGSCMPGPSRRYQHAASYLQQQICLGCTTHSLIFALPFAVRAVTGYARPPACREALCTSSTRSFCLRAFCLHWGSKRTPLSRPLFAPKTPH